MFPPYQLIGSSNGTSRKVALKKIHLERLLRQRSLEAADFFAQPVPADRTTCTTGAGAPPIPSTVPQCCRTASIAPRLLPGRLWISSSSTKTSPKRRIQNDTY